MPKNECANCGLSHKDPLFWETHQTMTDNNIWCVNLSKSELNKYFGVYNDEDLDRID
jgi:hypothetical protein